ncbi:MAG: 16S rRNA (cytidine(1402)-2'-O)-methyltransferase [Chitinophagales bacterium]|nr:16S rRNA (cytidine(1402)-2'-O)-methyltransferase [Chitinophagales bacterium]
MGMLYIVPTPIGNLKDITFRAIETLKEVDIILAEDTRQTQKLTKHYGIDKMLWSHHKFNEHKATDSIIQKLKAGTNFALVSDGGTPGISDPGFFLVRACIEAGVQIISLPGAVAFIPALINSGFPCDKFVFEGFLPHKKGRKTLLEKIAIEERTVILYESPHRIIKTLEQIIAYISPDRPIAISRELTKTFEENLRGTAAEMLEHFKNHKPKGEFVLIVGAENRKSKSAE